MITNEEKAIYRLGLCFGVDFTVFDADYKQRTKLQKMIYLFGIISDLEYLFPNFGLYIHGVYSSELNNIGYEIQKKLKNNEMPDVKLTDSLKEYMYIMNEYLPDHIVNDIEKLRLFTTMVMICKKKLENKEQPHYKSVKDSMDYLTGNNYPFTRYYNDAMIIIKLKV